MKFIVIKPFRDKVTKEDYVVDQEIECEGEIAENRIKLGLVKRIEKDNRPSKDNSIPSTDAKKGKKTDK